MKRRLRPVQRRKKHMRRIWQIVRYAARGQQKYPDKKKDRG